MTGKLKVLQRVEILVGVDELVLLVHRLGPRLGVSDKGRQLAVTRVVFEYCWICRVFIRF